MTAPSRRAWGALALVSGINLLNFADRYVISGVQELIKRDRTLPGGGRDAFGFLDDTSLGYLTFAFVVVLVVVSPIAGWLGDRVQRRLLVFGGVLVWSLATFASGYATTFGGLLAARSAIGMGEAGYATVAPGLLADLFPPSARGKAMGVFNVMIPVGAALGFGVGAAIGEAMGWRRAFLVAGAPGLVLAFLALRLPEPQRGGVDPQGASAGMPPWESLRALLGNRPFMVNCAGQALLNFTVGGLSYWMPSFFVRALGLGQAAAGLDFGILVSVAGLLGTVAGTFAGEWAERRRRGGYFAVSGVTLVAAVPFLIAVACAPGLPLTLAATFVALFLVLFNSAPLYTALLNDVPAGLRGSAMAFNLVAVHLLGDAPAGPMIGAVSDAANSLAVAIGAASLPIAAAGVLLFGYSRREAKASTGPVALTTP